MSDYFNLNEGVEKARSKLPRFGRFDFKLNKKLLFILAISIAIPATVLLAQQEQDNRQFASEKKTPPKILGYIVEYKSNPIARNQKKPNSPELVREKSRVEEDQKVAQKDILRRLNKQAFSKDKESTDKVKIIANFKYVLNGIALDISKEEADKLIASPYVKAVYPNYEVKAHLMDSVPLIGADNVWQEFKDKNGNSITGKGVNIAILDSGINPSHDDLGNTDLIERNFTKVNQDSLFYTSYSIDDNQLAYFYGGGQIVVLDLATGERKTITMLSSTLSDQPSRVFLKGSLIAYVNGSSLYFHDLVSGNKGLIGPFSAGEKVEVAGRKILYSLRNITRIYDVDTGVRTTLPRTPSDIGRYFSTYGDTVAFFTDTVIEKDENFFIKSICSGKISTLNLTTLERKNTALSNLGVLLDYNGAKVLHTPCEKEDFTSYELYDFNSLQETLLSDTAPNPSYPISDKQEGSLTESLAFFTNPTNKINAFSFEQNKTSKINIFMNATNVQAAGSKVCFFAVNIYCHDYDPSYNYPYPENVFNSKVVGGYNFENDSVDILDNYGHGTHVAAIAAGNGILKGVAPEANVFAYKVLDYNGQTATGSDATIMSGIDAAIATRKDLVPENDIDVMNLSLGRYCNLNYNSNCGPDDYLSGAIDLASENGIVSVISAGNAGSANYAIGSPGTARTAITVGSVDKSKNISSFSSIGPVNYNGEIINKPDVVAPGGEICAAFGNTNILIGENKMCVDDKHVSVSGTSMSSPHVVGLAALILQAYPEWTPQQVKDAIKNNADDLGLDINTQGAGLVNAQKIFSSIITPTPTPSPTPSPSPTPTLTPTPTPNPAPLKMTINAAADAFVRSTSPNSNFGTSTRVEVDSSPNEISYLKFNLVSLAGKTIVSAKLRLTVSDASTKLLNLRRGVNLDWSETGITYNNRPGFDATIRTFNASTVNSILKLDVKNVVNLRKGGKVTFGITSSGDDTGAFYSRESAASNRPQLIIQYR